MKKRYYIISGIIAYLVFLVVSIPAAPVLAQLQNRLPAIAFQGVSGGLWNGSVAIITINQQQTLNNTDWQVQAWKLLSGELSAHISTHYLKQPISGDIAIAASGKLLAQDVNASMDATDLAQLAQLPLAELEGVVVFKIGRLEWQQQQVPRATGTVLWNNATVSVAETARLGDLRIDITESDTQTLHASISNKGGEIKLEGEANVSEDGAYSLQLNLLPSKGASSNIRSSLGMFAKPKPDGSYQLENNGNLKQFGLI